MEIKIVCGWLMMVFVSIWIKSVDCRDLFMCFFLVGLVLFVDWRGFVFIVSVVIRGLSVDRFNRRLLIVSLCDFIKKDSSLNLRLCFVKIDVN